MDGSMGTSLYPERELWFSQSSFTGVNGAWVDMSSFVQDRGSFVVIAPAGLVAAVTVSFKTADADPAQNYCAPLLTTAAPLMQGGMCDPIVGFTIVIDPTDPLGGYSATKGQICRVPIQCRGAFVQAILSAATPGLSVLVVGKASRLFSI